MLNIWHMFYKFYRPLNDFFSKDSYVIHFYFHGSLGKQLCEAVVGGPQLLYIFLLLNLSLLMFRIGISTHPLLVHVSSDVVALLPATTVGRKGSGLWGLIWTDTAVSPLHLTRTSQSSYRFSGSVCSYLLQSGQFLFLLVACLQSLLSPRIETRHWDV